MAATGTSAARTYKSSVGVPESNRQAITALLNARLADAIDLFTQVKWAHWNLKGAHFIALHELFDSVAEHVEGQSDSIAERIAAIGGVANGTAREVAAKSGLKEADLSASDGPSQLRSEEHTSELQSQFHLVCRLLLEKKKRTGEGTGNSREHNSVKDVQ